MQGLVIAAGVVIASATWWLVAEGRLGVWRTAPVLFTVMGIAGLAFGDVALSGSELLAISATAATRSADFGLVLGLASGVVLYGATRAFVGVAQRFEKLRRHTEEQYRQALTVGPVVAMGLSVVTVVGEELFWRGLVQPSTASGLAGHATTPAVAAALATWVLFVLVNVWSRSLPIVAAALVGGLVWCALPLVSGGMLASMVCHLSWTILMLALPPRAGRGMMQV